MAKYTYLPTYLPTYLRISDSKGVNVFQNTSFKDFRILRWNKGRGAGRVVVCI